MKRELGVNSSEDARPPGECVHPRLWCGGGHTRWVERELGVNSSEDARHCSVLYICKYFVVVPMAHSSWKCHQLAADQLRADGTVRQGRQSGLSITVQNHTCLASLLQLSYAGCRVGTALHANARPLNAKKSLFSF